MPDTNSDQIRRWVERAVSKDETRAAAGLTKSRAAELALVLGEAPRGALLATDGHRMHVGWVDLADYCDADPKVWRALSSAFAPALAIATRVVDMPTAEQVRAACDLAEARELMNWHLASAEAYQAAFKKTGRAPKRDQLPDRAPAAVLIAETVAVNVSYLRDALAGLPRYHVVELQIGGKLDPVVVRRPDGIAVVMPMRADDLGGLVCVGTLAGAAS